MSVAEKPADAGAGTQKVKFDPNTLPAEVRGVYDSMLADYTRKTKDFGKKEKALNDQIAHLTGQAQEAMKAVQYYERLLPHMYGGEGGGAPADGGADPRGNGQTADFDGQWNPFDRGSADSLIRHHLGNYHKQLTEVYNGLVKGIMELQAYNLQLNRVVMAPLYQKLGLEMPDIQKIVQAAPQYGNNLEQAYRAVYESPNVWKNAQEYPTIVKERDELQAKLKALEARTPQAGVLGGTTGPVPRTVAKGQKPRTYAEIAASISPAEVFAPEGGGPVTGTAGAGGEGGAAGQ